jgi:hypothetical protein
MEDKKGSEKTAARAAVPLIDITLTTEAPPSQSAPPGYQPPITDAERAIVGDKRQ